MLAQLYRYNDSSFVYEEFDTVGKIVCKGLLTSQFEDTATIQVPDLANDPSGTLGLFRDTTVVSVEYGKQGAWMEREAGDTIWNGNYSANKKHGIWKRTQEVDHTRFPQVDTIVFYNNGIIDRWELPANWDSIFNKIKGKWYTNAVLSSKKYLFIQKDSDITSPESDFNFLQTDNCYQLYVGDSFWPESREYMKLKLSFVKKNEDWFVEANNSVIYQLLNITDRQIVLERY